MKPADDKIVKANPGLTPYELLTTKGLSESAFNELVSEEDKKAGNMLNANPAPPVKKLVPQNILKPSLSALIENLPHMQHGGKTGKVRIRPVSGGEGTEMSAKAANDLIRRNPNKYRIS